MGMFDALFSDENSADLALAAGLLGGRGNLGSILSKSLLNAQVAAQGASQRKRLAEMDALTKQRFQLDLDEAARKKQQYEKQQGFLDSLEVPSALGGVDWKSGQRGPTVDRANQVKPVDPNLSMLLGGVKSGNIPLSAYIAAQQKDDSPLLVPEGTSVLRRGTLQPLYTNPKSDKTVDQKDYAAAVLQGYQGNFIDYQREMANLKAPKTQVQVNTGQKGLDNELQLNKDFKSEPIYKDYQNMASAYKQIKAGIAANNPIGDLTAATKIMKLLDPDSVVRESELGMAMAASGRMDRMKSLYAQHVQGRKLNPQQSREFGELADELFEAAGSLYNQKRSQYKEVGERYKLNTNLLGPEHKRSDGWSMVKE